ncbi:MAG: glycosyl hydrolase family 18 protein [Clostridia bacterium]
MNSKLRKIVTVVLFFAIVLVIFIKSDYVESAKIKQESNLVIYGDNIKADFTPFVENGGIYISLDTLSKTIDKNIFYDKVATKVIITTHDNVIKLKADEKKMSKNLEYIDIINEVKIVKGQPFVPINILTDIYNIKVEYNTQTNTISIDKKSTSDIELLSNRVKVYSDISTKSNVIETLYKKNTVTIYKDSLNHARWYKVKTDTGVIGYISKGSVGLLPDDSQKSKEDEQTNDIKEKKTPKMTMFWQYGSDLDVLGKTQVQGVDIVSPTWYELKGSNGEITSKFSQEYYNQAKNMGYKIWPIITNGIDSASYSPSDTSAMLNSEYSREQFIKNLVELVKAEKVDGINIDFEAMKTEDKELYTEFIREMAPLLRKEGVSISVDMYFVAYIDRKGIGEASDYVVLMGYDQKGAWSNESGSVAEVSWVEKNITSLIEDSKIPSEKIILGIPFYTRLWTEKVGSTKPTTKIYTMKNCNEFLNKYKLKPVWDEDAGQNYAEYKEGDLTYKLWIEDKESVKKRIETVNKYNLAGVTGWRKGFETPDIWQTINDNLK